MGAFDKAGPSDKFNSPDSQLIPAGQKGRKRAVWGRRGKRGGEQNISRVFQKGLISQTREAKDDGPSREIDDEPWTMTDERRETREVERERREREKKRGGGFSALCLHRLPSSFRCIEKRRYANVLPHDG